MRLESALQIVGTLKRRFGEALTVTDICRSVSLSYQPVYDYVRQLTSAGAIRTEKQGQRLFCEPAATPSGALWLAHWSLIEAAQTESGGVPELVAALESRIGAEVAAGAGIVAIDPDGGGRAVVHTTVRTLRGRVDETPVHVWRRSEFADVLRAPDGDFSVARRIVPILGHALLWSIALTARDSTPAEPAPRPSPVRRRMFID